MPDLQTGLDFSPEPENVNLDPNHNLIWGNINSDIRPKVKVAIFHTPIRYVCKLIYIPTSSNNFWNLLNQICNYRAKKFNVINVPTYKKFITFDTIGVKIASLLKLIKNDRLFVSFTFWARTRPVKPGPIYNSDAYHQW